CLQYSSSPYNF
nr:immunoglobulin light chain junction region [Macaca mulatta]